MIDLPLLPTSLVPFLSQPTVELKKEGVIYQFISSEASVLEAVRQALIDSDECHVYYLSDIFIPPDGRYMLLAIWDCAEA